MEETIMEYVFGFFPKFKVTTSEESIAIKKAIIHFKDIKKVIYTDSTPTVNGQVYVSTDGSTTPTPATFKHVFYYMQKQSTELNDLLAELTEKGIEVTGKGLIGSTMVNVKIISGKEQVNSSGSAILTQTENGIVSIGGVAYDYIGFDWNEQKYRSGGKAIAGAIVGGILTGGIGTLAGAAIGGKRRDNSKAVIHLMKDDRNIQLIVECDDKKAEKLGKLVSK